MPIPKQRCKDIRDRFYPEDERPAEVYFRRITSLGGPKAVIVEVGCGRVPGLLRRVGPAFGAAYGFDPEITIPIDYGNIHLAPGVAERLNLPNESASLVVTMDVVEHLEDPQKAFTEFARVLRPGGRILVLTPNILHPPLFLARPLPHSVRQYLNRRATGTHSEDTFPTFYRANTVTAFKRLAGDLGLIIVSLEHVSNHPQYLMFSRLCYRIGVGIERNLLNTKALAFLRQYIVAELEKSTSRSGHRIG